MIDPIKLVLNGESIIILIVNINPRKYLEYKDSSLTDVLRV
jgi:hypothetical protein